MNKLLPRLLICLLFYAQSVGATDRYVNSSCPNAATTYSATTNACTGGAASVYSSIANMIGAMFGGDHGWIRAGTYNERIDPRAGITVPSGINDANRTQISGYPGERVVLFPTLDTGISIIGVPGKSYIAFDNFALDCSHVVNSESCNSIGSDSSTHHIRYTNIEAKNTAASQPSSATSGAAFLVGGDSNEFINIDCHDNGRKPGILAPEAPYCFYISGSGNLIDRSKIHHNGGYAVQQYKGSGGSNNNIIRANQIYENGAEMNQVNGGIVMGSGTGNVACSNSVWSTIPKNNLIGINAINSTGNNYVLGNSVTGFQYFGITTHEALGTPGITCQNNIAFNNGTNIECTGNGSSQDHNLTTDPLWVGPPADLHLRSGSPAISTGTDISAICPTDLDGAVRTVDIGAYKYTGGTSGIKAPSSPAAPNIR